MNYIELWSIEQLRVVSSRQGEWRLNAAPLTTFLPESGLTGRPNDYKAKSQTNPKEETFMKCTSEFFNNFQRKSLQHKDLLRSIMRRLMLVAALVFLMIAVSRNAQAETIQATLQFLDGDDVAAPIVFADVEIWRLSGICCWHRVTTVTTDANGRFSQGIPFTGAGTTYALRVFATNSAAQVFTHDIFTVPFYREPGLPGPEIQRRAMTSSDVLDFSFTFSDTWARRHFNVADAIRRGRMYADARRDPRETDTISRVTVLMQSSTATYYDPISHLIRYDSERAMDDFTVLHEYAHFLEESISSFYGIGASHNGCVASIGHAPGVGARVESPNYAWMEGFADYFAQAVGFAFGADVDGPGGSFSAMSRIESPSCPGETVPFNSQEIFVAGALFDIIDTESDFSGTVESGDQLCRTGTNLDTIVFQIFDRELDIGWTNPTLQQFADAWIARGLDMPPLLSTAGLHGVTLTSPAPLLHYDASTAANLAVWRPGGGAFWHILGGASGAPVNWGTWEDRPVPADYDGDRLTDVAVWRPSDGRWYVIKSASRMISSDQWGTRGDIPLPGDYDGDGEADFAVYRPSDGNVYIFNDSCGESRTVFIGGWLTPIVGDFDRNGVDEPGSYNVGTGHFWIPRTDLPTLDFYFGSGGGIPVIADFNGDFRSDVAVYRPDTGFWDIRHSSIGTTARIWWGEPDDVPVPQDYDNDNRADLATWNQLTGQWWVLEADGNQWTVVWGTRGDVPVAAP